jgi:bacteriorhodopsin
VLAATLNNVNGEMMILPDWLYAVASILAGVAIAVLTWKKQQRGIREDRYTLVGKLIIAVFMIAFGILLFKVGKS